VRASRIPALVVLGALLVGGLVLDRASSEPGATRVVRDLGPVAPGIALPAAAPPGSLTSTWFCAGGTAEDDGFADHTVVIQNARSEAVTATITVVGGSILPPPPDPPDSEDDLVDGVAGVTDDETTDDETTDDETTDDETEDTADADADAADDEDDEDDEDEGDGPTTTTTEAPPLPRYEPVVEEVEVPALARVEVRLGELIDAELAGAVVEVDGGEVAVEHTISGDLGEASAPCATTAGTSWSFPWGATNLGNRELLVLLNPFPDDATLDVEFATDEGIRTPGRFGSFVVPGRSVRAAYVDESTLRDQISAQITLRAGRVVVDRIQLLTGEGPGDDRQGMTLGTGAPAPAEVWAFPDGLVDEGVEEQIIVYNPNEEPAEVEVEVRLDDPQEHGFPEPFSLSIAPRRYSTVVLGDEDRIPPGVDHATLVRSLNRVPVVAERLLTAVDPAERSGVSAALGAPVTAATWFFPAGGPTDELDQWVTLLNLSTTDTATASFTGLANGRALDIADLDAVEVPPGARVSVRLGDHVERARLALVIEADGPIVAERGLYRVDELGMSNVLGIPLAGTITVPEALEPG
jgi:hypothetical protein